MTDERNSSGERLYADTTGAKCNIRGMIKREPDWVASRFDRMMDFLADAYRLAESCEITSTTGCDKCGSSWNSCSVCGQASDFADEPIPHIAAFLASREPPGAKPVPTRGDCPKCGGVREYRTLDCDVRDGEPIPYWSICVQCGYQSTEHHLASDLATRKEPTDETA